MVCPSSCPDEVEGDECAWGGARQTGPVAQTSAVPGSPETPHVYRLSGRRPQQAPVSVRAREPPRVTAASPPPHTKTQQSRAAAGAGRPLPSPLSCLLTAVATARIKTTPSPRVAGRRSGHGGGTEIACASAARRRHGRCRLARSQIQLVRMMSRARQQLDTRPRVSVCPSVTLRHTLSTWPAGATGRRCHVTARYAAGSGM